MNRRTFLILSGTTLGAAAVGGSMAIFEHPHNYIPALLQEYLGKFTMDKADERQFVDAFREFYGNDKIMGFVGLHRIREATSLGTSYTHSRVELFQRRLVSDFITSTDFFQKYQLEAVPHVTFRGFKLPCSNPFARRV